MNNKHKLTISALLFAAGTAFANAASVSVGESFFSTQQSTATGLNLGSSGNVSGLLDGSHNSVIYTYVIGNDNASASTWYYTSYGNTTAGIGSSVIPTVSNSGTGIGLATPINVFSLGEVAFIYNTISADVLTSLSGLELNYSATVDSTVDVAKIGVFYIATDDTNATNTTLLGVADLTQNATGALTLDYGKVDKNKDGYFAVAVQVHGSSWKGAGSALSVSGLSFSGSAVPEPSAFGLLAGIGALALVAARRRRGRKA